MTTLPKKLTIEQLRAIIAVYEKPFAMIGPIDYGYLAAKELLAVKLEQNAPVLYASPETLAYAKAGEPFLTTLSAPSGDANIALFTIPPTPALLDERHPVGGEQWGWDGEYNRGWNAYRAAMLNHVGGSNEKVQVVVEFLGRLIGVVNTVNHAKQHEVVIDDDPCYWQRQEWVEYLLEESKKAEEAYSAAMLQLSGNSEHVNQTYTLNYPVIPDGWKLVPNEPTTKQWAAGYRAMEGGIDKVTLAYRAMVEVAPSPGGSDDSHATAT